MKPPTPGGAGGAPRAVRATGRTRAGGNGGDKGTGEGGANNLRLNDAPTDLAGRITEAGRTERTLSREWGDYFSRTAMPAVRVPDFNMSTVSQAS